MADEVRVQAARMRTVADRIAATGTQAEDIRTRLRSQATPLEDKPVFGNDSTGTQIRSSYNPTKDSIVDWLGSLSKTLAGPGGYAAKLREAADALERTDEGSAGNMKSIAAGG
ncbi:hypothetical protein [Nocardia alni]|uniref:hypothetical protein n=1 Tax=Nocardia alni TaxID=2815723 RepID=UPI001C22DFF8|nr:hypothetical protein [Nocardia alni]